MDSDAVSYYATFDNYMVGTKQGEYIRDNLDLDNAAGPFNLEVFTGDPGDNNANFFYGGAMDVLNKYIDEGKLVIKSGQKEFADVATANWSTETAQSRMETSLLLTTQMAQSLMQFFAQTTLQHLVLRTHLLLTIQAITRSSPVRTVILQTLRT